MNCAEIVKNYLQGMNAIINVSDTDTGCIVRFPFVNPSNESIMVFIEKIGDIYRISDMSQTDEYLFLRGLDIKPNSKAEWYFQKILHQYGVRSESSEVYIEVEENKLVEGINSIISAINSIDHLIYTQNPRISPNFQDAVANWLDDVNVQYFRKKEIINRLTEPIKIDFEIKRKEKSPVFMQALHASIKFTAKNLAYKTNFQWDDLKDNNYNFYSIAMLDDTVDNVWDLAYPILKKRTDNVIFWDNRNDLLEILA